MKITKKQVEENLEEVKKYIEEIENSAYINLKDRDGNIMFKSSKSTMEGAVEEMVKKGDKNLRNIDLRYVDLSHKDLSNVDFSNAILSNTNLYQTILTGAVLTNTVMNGAKIGSTNLCDVDLKDTDLSGVDFYGRGDHTTIKKYQIPDFLEALGIEVID